MNIYIETYGCSANQAESEIIAGLLSKEHKIIKEIKNADIIIVNTCYVKAPTEQKVTFRIKQIQKSYPKKKLIITGCFVEGGLERLKKIAPDASLVSTHKITKIDQVVRKLKKVKKVEAVGFDNEVKLNLPRIRNNPIIGIVQISSGCNGACTYCATRLAKGKLFSYPKGKIIQEVSNAVKSGCKEIWLTSQDTGAYGLDKGRPGLPDLLKEIIKIPGEFFVRIGMMNPNNVKNIIDGLVRAYASKKIYKFLHLPIQSGDNGILKKMNRKYNVTEFENIVNSFRNAFKIQLWTDVIVGYPGESEMQFKNTLKVLKRLEPDYINVSRFGSRPDTMASSLKKLPTDVLKARSRKLSMIANEFVLKKNSKWVGWKGEILISEKGSKPGQWIGRNFAYKPILINKSGNQLGKTIKVKIEGATPTILKGWPIKN